MENRPTVTIKLKPYLQEFLRCKMDEEQLTAGRSFLGVAIKPFIELRPPDTAVSMKTGPEYCTITIPLNCDNLNTRNGTAYISEENQAAFERILNAHFWELFFNYMDDKVRYMSEGNTRKGTIKRVIMQFCSDYNISYNHLNYEMMKKAYYRRKLNPPKKVKKFSTNLSLTCPLLFLI